MCVYNFLVKCVKILLPTNLANTELIQILAISETSIVLESVRISTELKNTWLYVAVFFFSSERKDVKKCPANVIITHTYKNNSILKS